MKPSMLAALGCLVAWGMFGAEATAGQVFNYTFTDGTFSASGTLTANPNGNGTFTAVAGTSSVTGGGNTGTLAFVTNPNAPGLTFYVGTHSFDDQLSPGSNPVLSNAGLLFQFQNNIYMDIFSNGPSNYAVVEVDPSNTVVFRSQNPGAFTLTAVPEPSSMVMMMGTACTVGLGYIARRQRRATAA
jgi:PEP-CTERM motif